MKLFKRHKKRAKIIFFGTSDFSAGILSAIAAKHDVIGVITQPDKPVGRKHEITASDASKMARRLGIEARKPETLKGNHKVMEYLKKTAPELIIVAAYGKMIPPEILRIPKFGALNVHPSLLPKYRGPSPIQSALVNRERRTGVTIILMDEKMDHGPIVCKKGTFIRIYEFYDRLERRLCAIARKLILKAIAKAVKGNPRAKPQNESKATYCKLLSREDGRIDWTMEVEDVFSRFRGYMYWPEIWTTFKGKKLVIKNCVPLYDIVNQEDPRPPGLVMEKNGRICIACSKHKLEIVELQLEGRARATIRTFVNGHQDFMGSVLPN